MTPAEIAVLAVLAALLVAAFWAGRRTGPRRWICGDCLRHFTGGDQLDRHRCN